MNISKDLIEGDGRRLIESWKEYIDDDVDFKYWGDLFQAVATKVEYSSAQMVAKLLRDEIKLEEKKSRLDLFIIKSVALQAIKFAVTMVQCAKQLQQSMQLGMTQA